MRIGVLGLGKLGLPCALAVEAAGHEVLGWDPSHVVAQTLRTRVLPYVEQDAQALLDNTKIRLTHPDELAEWADLIFVAVQTPHHPEFEGVTRLTDERADFDYTYLEQAVLSVSHTPAPVVVISTVLPGTMDRHFGPHVNLLYNPFFIAMGTTIPDFRNPEFVLVGTDGAHPGLLREFYATIHDRPVFVTTVKTAELTKVAYNTFIGLKIAFANTMMELCEKTGADVDDLVDALSLADRRIISSAYMRGGMGDGGGCFPPGEMVLTAEGPRAIESIRAGDLVLTGDGSLQPVIKTWMRDYDGDIVCVKARGLLECRMTEDHPVIARTDLRSLYDSGRRRTDAFPMSDPEEVAAGALRIRDHRVHWPRHTDRVPAPEHVTESYLELAGWWLAEGSAELSDRRGRLRFDLHIKEEAEAHRIGHLLLRCAPPRASGRGGECNANA